MAPKLIVIFLSLWFKLRGYWSCWASIPAQTIAVMTDLFIYSPCPWAPATYKCEWVDHLEASPLFLNVFQKPGVSEN